MVFLSISSESSSSFVESLLVCGVDKFPGLTLMQSSIMINMPKIMTTLCISKSSSNGAPNQNAILRMLATNKVRQTYVEKPSLLFESLIRKYCGTYGMMPPKMIAPEMINETHWLMCIRSKADSHHSTTVLSIRLVCDWILVRPYSIVVSSILMQSEVFGFQWVFVFELFLCSIGALLSPSAVQKAVWLRVLSSRPVAFSWFSKRKLKNVTL